MTGSSVCHSNTGCARFKIHLEEHCLSSQESCNLAADPRHLVSLSTKDEESKNGPHVSGQIPTDTAASAVDDKIVPLSGNPYFTSIVSKYQLQHPFQVVVPKEFYQFLPSSDVPLVLSCRDKSWEVRYCGGRKMKRFVKGWKQFAVDNNLKVGDGCVFELMDREKLRFRVQILSGKIPAEIVSEFTNGADDGNFSNPIVID